MSGGDLEITVWSETFGSVAVDAFEAGSQTIDDLPRTTPARKLPESCESL
jgi:hypothetical protein